MSKGFTNWNRRNMRPGFRPVLQPPSHRCAEPEVRRPCLCLALSAGIAVFLVMVFGVTAWNIRQHWFGKNSLSFHNGDEVALSQVTNDLSVIFCDGYKVSLEGPGQIFLLPHKATVNTSFSSKTKIRIEQPAYREFNVWYLYLLYQSTINVTACRGSGETSPWAHIVLIQGEDNFQRWRGNINCGDCVLVHVNIPEDAHCDSRHRPHSRLFYQVESNDRYFIVIFNGWPGLKYHRKDSFIYLSGNVTRTHFDLTDAREVCYIVNSSYCYFELPWMASRDIVAKFEGRSDRDYRSTLNTRCQTRVIFWICLFGILPFVLIILVSVLFGCILCRPKIRKIRVVDGCQGESNGERERLLPGKGRQMVPDVLQDEDSGSMSIQLG